MLSALKAIVTSITSLINFVINTIKSLVMLIGKLPEFINYVTAGSVALPVFILTFFTVGVSVAVLKFVINR